MRAREFVKENSLSLFFLAIFLAALVGQAVAGHNLYNEEAIAHKEETISFWRYLRSSSFGNAVMENWQSEYLQFALFALATVWLLQKGSPESKELDKAGTESDKEQKVGRWAREDSPLGQSRRAPHHDLLEQPDHRDGPRLPRLLARPVGHRLDRLQLWTARARRSPRLLAGLRRQLPVPGGNLPDFGSFSAFAEFATPGLAALLFIARPYADAPRAPA